MNAQLSLKKEMAQERLAHVKLPDDWRRKRAEQARDWLFDNGLPSKRDHFWSYTDPKLLAGEVSGEAALSVAIDAVECLPDTEFSNDALEILPLAKAEFAEFGEIIARAHEKGARPLAELALIEGEGVVINVKGDAGIVRMAHEHWPQTGYVRINLAKNARLTLVETISKAAQKSIVIEADLQSGAEFDHLRIAPQLQDRLHLQLFAELADKADLRSFNLVAPSSFRRFESVITLNGDDSHVSVAGANYLHAPSFHDDTVYITHSAENCVSRQVFKRVIGDDAHSIFQGKIFVTQGAQKTDGYQISQGLMLADGGEALSKPELEIYADDVACSHGSTTSGLDETALFYLRSRGVDLDMAQKLLIRAFLDEAFDEIRDENLRGLMANLAEEWVFGQAL